MFTLDDIQRRVRERPFRPLRIVTSAGETFDLYHPDLILLGLREVVVGLPGSGDPAHFDRLARIAIMHITALHDLPTVPASPSNGQS